MATVHIRKGRSVFYVRVHVPTDLQVQLGREEISRSLRTSDPSLADCRSKVADAKAAILFHTVRRHPRMTPAQIRALVSRYIGERLDEWEEALAASDLDETVNGQWQDAVSAFAQSTVDECTAALRALKPTASPDAVKDFMERYKLTHIALGSSAYRLLSRELTKAERVIQGKIKERVQGEYGDEYGPVIHQVAATEHRPDVEPELRVTLSEAIPAYLKHIEHRAPGTLEAKRNVLKRFLEIVTDKPVHSILKRDRIVYRDTLAKLPANAAKRFPGMPLAQVLERAKEHPKFAPLSKVTISQDLTHLITFFSWLIDEGKYTGPNPAVGLAYEGVEKKAHEAYSDADIQTIFGSDEFNAQKDDTLYSSRYWLPLILLHTGARREEIANLALSDIRQEEGIWCFDIAPDIARGRRIKNKSSKRRTPIHSHLIKAGLLEYVELRKANGDTLLFTKRNTIKGRATAGDAVSKWWHRLMKRLRVPGDKTLHGLRPTVTTKLHAAGVDGETRREILGHSGKDVHETVYLRLSVKTLSESLEKLRYKF
jgi:integrase